MTDLFIGLGIVIVAYVLGFVVGVWSTHSWVESIAPGMSQELFNMEARRRNHERRSARVSEHAPEKEDG